MNIRLRALGLVYTRYGCSGKNHDRYVLRDRRLTIVGEEARVRVAERISVAVGIIGWERCVFWVQACGCDGCRGPRGGEIVRYDSQGKQGYVVFLGQADGCRRSRESGPKSAMEGCEGYAEIDGVVFDGGLDCVGFENCVLMAASQLRGCSGKAGM